MSFMRKLASSQARVGLLSGMRGLPPRSCYGHNLAERCDKSRRARADACAETLLLLWVRRYSSVVGGRSSPVSSCTCSWTGSADFTANRRAAVSAPLLVRYDP